MPFIIGQHPTMHLDDILKHKSGFLNKTFFTVWTVLTIVLWSLLGKKMRNLSLSTDERKMSVEEGKKFHMEKYSLGCVVSFGFCTYSYVNNSLVVVNEH